MSQVAYKHIELSPFLKSEVHQTVEQIESFLPRKANVQLLIEPEVTDKSLFSIALKVTGLRKKTLFAKHSGKDIHWTLRQAKKRLLRQINNCKSRNAKKRDFRRQRQSLLWKGGHNG